MRFMRQGTDANVEMHRMFMNEHGNVINFTWKRIQNNNNQSVELRGSTSHVQFVIQEVMAVAFTLLVI